MVNWVICRDNNGQNGWQDCTDFRNQVELMFTRINEWYSNSLPKGYTLTCEPTYNHVTDTRIRFELNEIIFINNTSFNESCYAGNILNYLFDNYPQSKKAMNHIFTMPPEPCRENNVWGYYSIFNNESYVHTYYSMYSDWFVVWNDHIEHIAHEYGHAVGQGHTYDSEITEISHYDFLDDVFGLCAEQSCEQDYSPTHVSYLTKDCFWEYQTPPFPLMSGNNINSRYISPKSAGRMHRALSLYDNSFSINNKPMHKYVKEKYPYELPLVINEDETWDFAIKMYQDIIIESNVTMTISGMIKMPINGKIIIKPGGKLIIDGGTITNAHYEGMWQGIQVWGIDNLHQNTINGRCLQGFLEMKNGATIENAVCAVDLWNPLDNHSEGGVVQATNATFRNNAKSIHAINYSNYNQNSGLETQNISYLRKCSFIIDTNYVGNETFYNHVELNNVDGFKFYGCTFSANNNLPQVSSTSSGIYANSAGFSIDSHCNSAVYPCPESQKIRSSFSGFNAGIYVTNNGGSARTFTVSNSNFSNNGKGIYAINTGYATIIQNNFSIGSQNSYNYGIYLNAVSNFCIEENNFTATKKLYSYGVFVSNSASYNDIYLNNFSNLYYGNIASGVNIVSNNPNLGLTYTCNTNSGNTNDFGVVKENSQGYIRTNQGSSSIAAANTFSASNYHFYNEGNTIVKYYYNGTKIPSRRNRVTIAVASADNECESHYNVGGGGGSVGGGIVMSNKQTDSIKNKYANSLNSYNNLKNISTYKIEKDSTQRIMQESQLSMLQRECQLAAGDIVRSNLNKEERNFNELREWLGKSKDMNSNRMIIASYIQQKDFVNAIALAKTLPGTYNLQGEELSEYYDYLEIIRLHESLAETNRNTLQLTDYEISLLENISEKGSGTSKAMAEAILAEYKRIPAPTVTLHPDIPAYTASRNASEEELKMSHKTEFKVELTPNPATTAIEVKYILPEGETTATFIMTNTLGVNVMTTQLYNDNTTTTLNIEDIPSGIYIYNVRCGENVKTGKLIKK